MESRTIWLQFKQKKYYTLSVIHILRTDWRIVNSVKLKNYWHKPHFTIQRNTHFIYFNYLNS